MVQIKIKAVKGSYHVFAVYDDADLFFDELAQRLKQCCIRTARFEAFFHIENLTQKDLVRLFKLCEQINLKILGFDEMPQPSIGIHEGNLRYAREYEFTEPLILFGNIEKSVSVCAKANLYVLGHVQGVLDFLYADCVLYASSLCANVRIHDTSFQNLMNVLFKNEHSAEEKLEILRKQFGIKVTETMEEEVEEMSHICMYYEQEGKKAGLTEGMLIGEKRGVLIGERRGKKSGLAKGIKQGKREGETKQINATISYVKNLMQKKNMTLKEAFDLLEIERDMQEKI